MGSFTDINGVIKGEAITIFTLLDSSAIMITLENSAPDPAVVLMAITGSAGLVTLLYPS
jgi:hypothetical protein